MADKTKLGINEYIDSLLKDSFSIVADVSGFYRPDAKEVEFSVELPAAVDHISLTAMIERWISIRDVVDKDIRIYAWSYNKEVEKLVSNMLASQSRIYITILPFELKGVRK